METQVKIEVGSGAFTGFNGDRYPYTVIEVINDKTIVVQRDDFKRAPGGHQHEEGPLKGEFIRNPQGERTTLTLRRNGRWVPKGTGMREGWHWGVGVRYYSRNPHF